jgi:hypothetical protein
MVVPVGKAAAIRQLAIIVGDIRNLEYFAATGVSDFMQNV